MNGPSEGCANNGDLAAVTTDTPLRLDVAAKLAYPFGGMTASGLLTEARRGRLVMERVAGKYYTTLANIKRMRELCELCPDESQKVPASGYGRSASAPAVSPTMPHGSSSIEAARSALDATLTSLERRNGR
jgi:hypothetical protein